MWDEFDREMKKKQSTQAKWDQSWDTGIEKHKRKASPTIYIESMDGRNESTFCVDWLKAHSSK